jgi:hypothetical protein
VSADDDITIIASARDCHGRHRPRRGVPDRAVHGSILANRANKPGTGVVEHWTDWPSSG